MATRQHLFKTLPALLLALMHLLLGATPALAATSPGGLIQDHAESLTEKVLVTLEEYLANRRFAYRVVILERAFDEEAPADKEIRFQQLAEDLLADLAVPLDTILITVAMHEKLVDFRVWADSPVNAAFMEATGRDFGAHTPAMLQAFAGMARSANIDAAILAAVIEIEKMTTPNPAPTPAPPAPAPAPPAPTPPPSAPDPVPSTQPPTPSREAPPDGPVTDPRLIWVGLLVAVVSGGAVLQLILALRYRRKHKEVVALRDSFVGELVRLIQQELPLARGYSGEETVRAVQMASLASDRALQAYQAGMERCQEAEGLARRWRVIAASRLLAEVKCSFAEAAVAHAEAKAAYAPIGEAVRMWDESLAKATAKREEVQTNLTATCTRTGWGLSQFASRFGTGAEWLQQGETARPTDPVRAMRLVRDSENQFDGILEDLQRLEEQERAYQEQKASSQRAEAEIQETRQALGLRFVEVDPVEALALAQRHEATAALCMPEGDVEGAEQALKAAGEAVSDVRAILARYREAVEQYPVQRQLLAEGAGGLAGEQVTAREVVGELTTRFAVVDWQDVKDLPMEMASLEKRIWAGLNEVARLTSPQEQLHLQAHRMLTEWLDELQHLRLRLGLLVKRPGELAEMESQARDQLLRAEKDWNAAVGTASRLDLILPVDLAGQAHDLESQLSMARHLMASRPLPVSRVAGEASQVLEWAARLRRAVDEVGRRAVAARERLDRARRESNSVLRHARHAPQHASNLQRSLSAASQALATGQYDQALAEAEGAIRSCRALVDAHRRYEAEKERQRRAAMAAASAASRASSSRSSGGGGGWGSSSGSSGGGGSWGSSSRSTGGGGSWGSSSNKGGSGGSSGGGGSWG